MAAPDVEATFRSLVPRAVAVYAAEALAVSDPLAEEAVLVENAIEKRQAEFLTSRDLARQALSDRGVVAGPIGRGEHRQPEWPEGAVATITHTSGICAAAAAHDRDLAALGIDLERLDRDMSDGVVERIAPHPDEAAVAERFGDHWALAVFCSKEAIYKALYPTVGEIFGFGEVIIRPGTHEVLDVELSDWLRTRLETLGLLQVSCAITHDHVHSAAYVLR